jgi:hypothetical protein
MDVGLYRPTAPTTASNSTHAVRPDEGSPSELRGPSPRTAPSIFARCGWPRALTLCRAIGRRAGASPGSEVSAGAAAGEPIPPPSLHRRPPPSPPRRTGPNDHGVVGLDRRRHDATAPATRQWVASLFAARRFHAVTSCLPLVCDSQGSKHGGSSMKAFLYAATFAVLVSTPVLGEKRCPLSALGLASGTALPRSKDGAAALPRWSSPSSRAIHLPAA